MLQTTEKLAVINVRRYWAVELVTLRVTEQLKWSMFGVTEQLY
jgi:hypothetical protein